MTRATATPRTVTSRDGTAIAVWRSGRGRPLLMVHGSLADHTRWETVRPLLEPDVTLYAMDRRGRGASGDAERYALEEEAADVAAAVEAIAEDAGGPVDVFGHSYGAHCALEGTLLTSRIRRLVLYEPAIHAVSPPGLTERLADLLAQGRREDVVTTVLRELLQLPDEQVAQLRADPSWPGRVAAAHTIVRECRAEEAYVFRPERFARVEVPTLLMTGSASPPQVAAETDDLVAALPGARVVTLAGHGHVAMTTAPQLFAATLLGFLREDSSPRGAARRPAAATGGTASGPTGTRR